MATVYAFIMLEADREVKKKGQKEQRNQSWT